MRRKSWREVCQVASTASHISFSLSYRYLDQSCSYMSECSSPLRCPHLPSFLTDFCSQFTIDFRKGIPQLTVATWKSLRQVPHAQSGRRPWNPRANSKVTTGFETCLTEEMWMHLVQPQTRRRFCFLFYYCFISNPLWKNNCRACTNKFQSRHSIVLNIQIFCKYFYPDYIEVRTFVPGAVWLVSVDKKN